MLCFVQFCLLSTVREGIFVQESTNTAGPTILASPVSAVGKIWHHVLSAGFTPTAQGGWREIMVE